MRWWKRLPKVNEEKEKELQEEMEKDEKVTFKDYFAMFISAFIVFIPTALLVLLFLYFVAWLFFMRG